MNEIGENWVGIAEASKLMDLSRQTISELARKGRIRAQKVGPRFWMVNLEDLLEYKREMRELGTAKYSPKRNPEWEQEHSEYLRRRYGKDESDGDQDDPS